MGQRRDRLGVPLQAHPISGEGPGPRTYMEKLVTKAFLGSSMLKMASWDESALLTTRLVTTVWANRELTLESTMRL